MSYWLVIGLLALSLVSLIVLLWSLIAALWSINRTLNETRHIWDEAERSLHRLNQLLDHAESGSDKRSSS
jgi:uncharacterized BrkB/YihY/UPF0761 family membrane protein